MEQNDSNPTNNNEESIFINASDSFNSDHSFSSFSDIDNIALEPPESLLVVSEHISKELDSHSHDHNISTTLNNNVTLETKPNTSNNDISLTTNIANVNDEPITSLSSSSFIYTLAGLVIKLIGMQLNLLVKLVTFPVMLSYYSYVFLFDPFTSIKIVKRYILENVSRVFELCFGCMRWIMRKWIRNDGLTWNLCERVGLGLLWLFYVGFVLVSLLVFAFLVSGVVLKCVMEESVVIREELIFDYTKESPTAFVPIMACPESDFLECGERIRGGISDDSRVIPLDHKVLATVSLTLPESYYNRNLGIFQVRIDFLSRNGQHLASTRQPCMLQFKSPPIRLMLTFLNLAPLVTGYSSESQTLNIKFRGYTERSDPTSCLRVILEQRAEFTKGGGIPEIYEAFLKLESQPPFLKRILWSWKGTIYIWISTMIFVVELLFTLVCCTPIIVPRLQPRGVSSNNNAPRSNLAGQS